MAVNDFRSSTSHGHARQSRAETRGSLSSDRPLRLRASARFTAVESDPVASALSLRTKIMSGRPSSIDVMLLRVKIHNVDSTQTRILFVAGRSFAEFIQSRHTLLKSARQFGSKLHNTIHVATVP